ncbi:NAD(P)/FAD-dependent oxidoreductase [Allopusillimonas ginsengisoli]|uniref:NAD(P)/FAD-dependent oxidoreductase n=1 Tax=Allopusillimonas ginsengisoli TaxID=453575 RepID=UPI0039C2EE28
MSDVIKTDTIIIGGGIVGASAALFLRRRGVQVVLIDAAQCGSKASGVNYGGVRRQGRSLELLPLSQRAFELWAQLGQLIDIDGEYIRSGHLKLARSRDDFGALETYRAQTRGFGMNLELLSGGALQKRFPWVGPSVYGASLCPEDGHANPRIVSPAFARAAHRAGAVIMENTRVVAASCSGNGFELRCDNGQRLQSAQLVNCAGAWGADVARLFGEDTPLLAIHPAMAVTEPLPVFIDVNIGIQGGGAYIRQVARGNCVVGGARGFAAGPHYAKPGAEAITVIMQRLGELVPGLRHAQLIRSWSGYEGSFGDGKPVIGPSATTPGLFHAYGFCGEGFQTGPAVGEVLADFVTHGKTSIPMEPFSIQRFGR